MSDINFRKGATQVERAAFNASMVQFLGFEILVSACAAGIYFKSWTWGLGVFLGLVATFNMPQCKALLATLYSIGWGIAGYWLLSVIAPDEPAAPFIAGVAALLFGLGAHQCFFQWQKDFK